MKTRRPILVRHLVGLTILALSAAGCSGGSSGGGSQTPPGNTSDQKESCVQKRRAYVLAQVGQNASVEQLMDHILEKETAPNFWQNLPNCYEITAN